ncbi:MAG: lysine--tRNA ligase, partial [Candidatus Aenigmatarchaeota archaeon]
MRIMGAETGFWVDSIADELERRKKNRFVIGGGISASGRVHLGNLRSDVIVPDALRRVLEERGYEVSTYLIAYSQDPFKAKPSQLIWFEDPEYAEKMIGVPKDYSPSPELIEKYKGRRLIDIPDPLGCCNSWIHHFWKKEFEPLLERFGKNPSVILTSEFYKMEKTKEAVRKFLEKREDARYIINRYRKRNPHPEGWIPFNPWCVKCSSIEGTTALDIDLDKWRVYYRCDRCGHEGWSPMEEGKLDWRLEWSTIWYVTGSDCEPYGKDHAAAGGSRESSVELLEGVLGGRAPLGFFCEWVGKVWEGKDMGDMTSSGNILFSPAQWLEVSPPQVLRYLYIAHKHTKRFSIDLSSIYKFIDDYDRAERVFFGLEEEENDRVRLNLTRGYELSQLEKPEKPPTQIPYTYAALLSQVFDPEKDFEKILQQLRRSGHITGTPHDTDYIQSRLLQARRWAEKYAPENYRIEVLERVPPEVKTSLTPEQKNALLTLAKELRLKDWNEKDLQNRIYELRNEFGITSQDLFAAIY